MAAFFTAYALSTQNKPVSGCAIRLISPEGTDVTGKLTGNVPILTGPDGSFAATINRVFYLIEFLAPGTYTVLASAPGYAPYSEPYAVTTPHIETLTVSLSPVAAAQLPTVVYNGPGYVSPLYPVELEVPAASLNAPWELIEATLQRNSGGASLIQVPVIDQKARLNLAARLVLDPLPHFVPDNAAGLVDNDFSGGFSATFASITPTGRVALNGGLTVQAGNITPLGDDNDLTNYTNVSGLADWITPWDELPVFAGHYQDAIIWLPVVTEGDYQLRIVFADINRKTIATRSDLLDPALFVTGQATRIRIPSAITGASYARLTINQGVDPQTNSLTVRYVHG